MRYDRKYIFNTQTSCLAFDVSSIYLIILISFRFFCCKYLYFIFFNSCFDFFQTICAPHPRWLNHRFQCQTPYRANRISTPMTTKRRKVALINRLVRRRPASRIVHRNRFCPPRARAKGEYTGNYAKLTNHVKYMFFHLQFGHEQRLVRWYLEQAIAETEKPNDFARR